MKALVTGCAGFIGSNLTDRLLSEGYDVIGIDSFSDYYSRSIKESNISTALTNHNFLLIEKEILSMDNFPDVDVVFHLAAQAGVRASWGESFSVYLKDNIQSTQRLLEWYKKKSIKKFVYASSSSVYGDAPLPMNEEMRLQPVSPYGVTKLAAEHLCYLYWKNFQVPTIALRYFTVYGPRQRPDMAIHLFVNSIMNENPLTLYGDGSQTRDFTYISDIIEANILASQCSCDGEVFNIGGGSRITVNNLIQEIEQACDRSAKIHYEQYQKGDTLDTHANICKVQKYLGWEPKVSIREGIKKFVLWFNEMKKMNLEKT
jgi:UDP-glucose 4-epimerase